MTEENADNKEISTTEEQVQSETQEETVSLEEATDEELEAAIRDSLQEVEVGEEETLSPSSSEGETPKKPEPQEPPKEQTPNEEERDPQDLRNRLEQVQIQGDRRLGEIQSLRSNLTSQLQGLQQRVEADFQESPIKGNETLQKIKEIQGSLESLVTHEVDVKRRVDGFRLIANTVGDLPVEDIAKDLSLDGMDEGYIRSFTKDPYGQATPSELLLMAKRAIATGYLKRLVPAYKKLLEENKKLKESSKVQVKEIASSLKKVPALNGKSGTSSKSGPKAVPPHVMSDAELEQALKEASRQGL